MTNNLVRAVKGALAGPTADRTGPPEDLSVLPPTELRRRGLEYLGRAERTDGLEAVRYGTQAVAYLLAAGDRPLR